MFPLDDNFVFGDIFFLWLIFFFWPKAEKKNTLPKKKILTNKRSYSSNGNTYMPMIWRFYAPPPTKKYRNTRIFNRRPRLIFFLPKKTSWIWYFQLVNFHFIFDYAQVIAFFLPLWTFHSLFFWENDHFFLKSFGTWYKFLIVIFFFKKQKHKKMHIQQHFTEKKYQDLKSKHHDFNILKTNCFGMKNVISAKKTLLSV